jgi:iron complex transport system substrate-binding protein
VSTAIHPTLDRANRIGGDALQIVSLAASLTEIVFALGAGEQWMAVSTYCDHPAAALEKPKAGSLLHADYAAIERARPDLVLPQSHLQREIVARLVDLNINVLSLNPTSLVGVIQMVPLIGNLVGRQREAESLAEAMRARIEAVRAASLTSKPRVYFEQWGSPLIPAGGWEAECVEVAGRHLFIPGACAQSGTSDSLRRCNPRESRIDCGVLARQLRQDSSFQNQTAGGNGKRWKPCTRATFL